MAKELKKGVSPVSLKDTLSAEDETEKLGWRAHNRIEEGYSFVAKESPNKLC